MCGFLDKQARLLAGDARLHSQLATNRCRDGAKVLLSNDRFLPTGLSVTRDECIHRRPPCRILALQIDLAHQREQHAMVSHRLLYRRFRYDHFLSADANPLAGRRHHGAGDSQRPDHQHCIGNRYPAAARYAFLRRPQNRARHEHGVDGRNGSGDEQRGLAVDGRGGDHVVGRAADAGGGVSGALAVQLLALEKMGQSLPLRPG